MMEISIILLIFLIIYPYTIYPAILFLLSLFINKKNMNLEKENSQYPSVTILIAAYNEEKVIACKLKNSLNLIYPPGKLKIIVASDGSNDRTGEIVRYFADKHDKIGIIEYNVREGKANVLNKAIKICDSDIVIFSDANAYYHESSVMKIIKHFNDKNVGCVAGEKRIVDSIPTNNVSNNEGLYWRIESYIKRKESAICTVIGADGALYAIRRQLYETLPINTSVDDFLISMNIVLKGYKIVYEPQAISFEGSGSTIKEEFNRKVRIASGNYYNLKYLTGLFKLSMVSFMFISHKLLRWMSPFIYLLLTLVLTIEYKYSITRIMLIILMANYVIALVGYYAYEKNAYRNKILNIITYFYMTVFAQLIGYLKYLHGSQKAIWEKAR